LTAPPTADDSRCVFPVTYSILASEALQAEVSRAYSIEPLVDCALLRSYVNDVYVLHGAETAYIVKVYRAGWRSWSEIAYELDVLTHLTAKGVPVAPPLPRRDGQLIGTLSAPERTRYMVLFPYAAGVKPTPPFMPDLYHSFGSATARMYNALDDFASPHPRVPLDLAYLLDRPLSALRPLLTHRPDDWRFLVSLADKVRARITSLAEQGLDWGVCHGDLTLDNLHVDKDNGIIFYDFDTGGPGWRAVDPCGVFQHWSKAPQWDAFLQGYTEERSFGAADRAAVPYFVAANGIWSMGSHARNWTAWRGLWLIDDEYFDEQLTQWRLWDSEQLRGG
jgi:Ser/Thr protein kinase RdoA (MazF antagonist)